MSALSTYNISSLRRFVASSRRHVFSPYQPAATVQSRLTPSPLRSHRLPSKRSPERLPLKPFGRSLGLAAALVAATGLAPVAAARPALAPNECGDLALAPYYTVRDEWVTGLHIVNTSARAEVVKVRFRRATDAMDALDFNLVLRSIS